MIIKKICTVIFITFVTVFNVCSFANENTQEPNLITGNFDGRNHDSRIESLIPIEEKLTEINSYIPNPSPDEIKWINKEESEIDKINDFDTRTNRYIALSDKVPYQELVMKRTIDRVLTIIKAIKDERNIKVEMYYWAKLSSILGQSWVFHDGILVLKKAIKFPTYIDTYQSEFIRSYGDGILKYILLPYLQEEAKR